MPRLDKTMLAVLGASTAIGVAEGLAERGRRADKEAQDNAKRGAMLPNGWIADDAAYAIAQAIRSGAREQAGGEKEVQRARVVQGVVSRIT